MDLKSYIGLFPGGLKMSLRKILARELGVSDRTIRSWEYREIQPREETAQMISQLTKGRVSSYDLRAIGRRKSKKINAH